MRKLLLVFVLALVGCASSPQANDGKVRVTGIGKTFDEAKLNGFQKAVEIVVGSVILAETKALNDKLVKDEIIQHSAGYVDDFTILNRSIDNGKHVLGMEVVVRSSKIAERVLGRHVDYQNMNGDRMAAQYNTYIKDRTTGDRALQKLLNDYPKYAFNLSKGKVEFKTDRDRNAVIYIPWELRWNYKYIVALRETLTILEDGKSNNVRQNSITITAKNPDDWVIGVKNEFYFSDRVRYQNILDNLVKDTHIHIDIKDVSGKTLFKACGWPSTLNGRSNVQENYWLRGTQVHSGAVVFKIYHGTKEIELINQINEVEMYASDVPCN